MAEISFTDIPAEISELELTFVCCLSTETLNNEFDFKACVSILF